MGRADFLMQDQRGDYVIVEVKMKANKELFSQIGIYRAEVRKMKAEPEGKQLRAIVFTTSLANWMVEAKEYDISWICKSGKRYLLPKVWIFALWWVKILPNSRRCLIWVV